jgi:hypothetical protein
MCQERNQYTKQQVRFLAVKNNFQWNINRPPRSIYLTSVYIHK